MNPPEQQPPASDQSPDDLLREAIRIKDEDPAAAIMLLNQAHGIDPTHKGVLEQIGFMFLTVRHFDQAANCFERLVALDRTNPDYLSTLGAIYSQSGRANEAVDILQKSIRARKDNADAYYHLGVAYRQLKNTSMARYAFREAIKCEPQLGIAYYELGQSYFEAGSNQQAIDQYHKALEATPTLEVARTALENATQAKATLRTKEQFGRLVNVETLSKKPEENQQITPEAEALIAHYDAVRPLLKAMKPMAEDFSAQVVDKLCPLLRDSIKLVTRETNTATLVAAREKFREELRAIAKKRKELRKLVVRFAAHTEIASARDAG